MKANHPLKLAALAMFLGAALTATDADAQRSRNPPAAEEQFPEATREAPKGSYSNSLTKQIKKLQDAYGEDGKEEETIAAAEVILAHAKAKPYDRGVALMTAGAAANTLGDDERAISYLSRAVEENALSNNNHYSAMINLSSAYINSERYDEADAVLARLVAETKTDNADVYSLQAASFYNNDKYAEAIAPLKRAMELRPEGDGQWRQMLMAAYAETGQQAEALKMGEELHRLKPDDKTAIINLAVLYTDAEMPEKAVAVLDDARKRGLMNEPVDYERIYGTYFNLDREKEAASVIEEGLASGVLAENSKYYMMLAQAHYFSDNPAAAITAAQKATPLATEGEPSLFLAQMLDQEDRNAEALAAARQALAKGLKKPGDAWMVIARAEYYSDNPAGAKEAYREAMKDPSTKDQAQKALAQISR